jgi:hypothetical protein
MRTTLDIADDVLFAAKDFARRNQKTLGQTLSDLARRALQMPECTTLTLPNGEVLEEDEVDNRFRAMGFAPFKHPQGRVVTNEMVNALREQEGI